jgi:hypothetical protein
MDSAQIAELMWKCIADAATAGQRAITMYLAILAGITGYLINVTLQKDVMRIGILCDCNNFPILRYMDGIARNYHCGDKY